MRTSDWLIIGMIGLVFAPAALAVAEEWGRLSYYSHGYLVLVVALWAAHAKRDLLATLRSERDRRGLLVLGIALALYLAGTLASTLWLQGIAVVLAVASAVFFLRGFAWVRALTFPIGLLIFTIPIPDALLTPVIIELQLAVSAAAVWILHSAGMPILREGNVISLPGGESLFVTEACSGITSIITLFSLGFIVAYYTERSLGRRAVLMACVVPIAMVANLLRVLGIVLASRSYGVTAIKGGIHDSAGMLVYVLACLALIGIGRLMHRVMPPKSKQSAAAAVE